MRTPPPVVVRCQFGSVWRVFQAVVLGLASSVLVLRWGLHDLSLGESAAHGLYLLCVSMGLVATTVGWRMLAARRVAVERASVVFGRRAIEGR
jgi:hypothetical protein